MSDTRTSDVPFATSGICDQFYAFAHQFPGQTIETTFNGLSCLVVQNPDDADRVLRTNHANYAKNMRWFRQALGPSRFSEDGSAWEERRALTHRHFSDINASHLHGVVIASVETMLDAAFRSAEGAPVPLPDPLLRHLAADVLTQYFFHLSVDDTGVDLEGLSDLVEVATNFSFMPLVGAAPEARAFQLKILDLRRRALGMLSGFRHMPATQGSLLAALQAADADPGSSVTLEHELLTFFSAGAESSAATLGWAMHLLASWPGLQEELHASLCAVPEEERRDLKHLASNIKLRTFLSEALRLFPPTPILGRVAIADDQLGAIRVHAGQTVLLSLIGVHHAPQLRANPWKPDIGAPYNASRFPGLVGAFSVGPRICGGKNFSIVELMSAIAVLVLRCRFDLVADEPVKFYWKAQMLRAGGHRVLASPRLD